MAGRGQREPDHEGLAPVEPVHVVERDDAADHGDDARGGVGDERCAFREPCLDPSAVAYTSTASAPGLRNRSVSKSWIRVSLKIVSGGTRDGSKPPGSRVTERSNR